jgi:hypothetical protein
MKHLKLFNSITESSSPSLTPQQKLDSFIDSLNLTSENRNQLDDLISDVKDEAFRDGRFEESYYR